MYLVGSVLFGADSIVADFVAARIPHVNGSFGDHVALGVVRNGKLIGGVVYHNYRRCDICVSIAFDSPAWAFPATLRLLFAYPFRQLGCARITCLIARRNKASRRLCEGLGFRLEGVMRKGADGHQDACLYGLLEDECRWLRRNPNGKE